MDIQTYNLFLTICFCAVLMIAFLMYQLYLSRKQIKEMATFTSICFENEQDLANRLEQTYKALSESNVALITNEESLRINRIRENRIVLHNNNPENLDLIHG